MQEQITTTPSAPRRSLYGLAEEKDLTQLIVFHLGDEEFAIDIQQVREIVKVGSTAPIPDSPAFIKGVTNVRGEIIIVINLRERFFLPEEEEDSTQHVVISRDETNPFGLTVDEVTEVMRIAEKEIRKAPNIVTKIHREYVRGVVTEGERLIIVLDLSRVLQEEELVQLSEMQTQHGPDGRHARHRDGLSDTEETAQELHDDQDAEAPNSTHKPRKPE